MAEIQLEKLRDIYKAIGNVNRIKILHLCLGKELSVSELSSQLKISYTLTSEYISMLEKQGLIKKTKHPDNSVSVKSLVRFNTDGSFQIAKK